VSKPEARNKNAIIMKKQTIMSAFAQHEQIQCGGRTERTWRWFGGRVYRQMEINGSDPFQTRDFYTVVFLSGNLNENYRAV
jgi:hypothetical protein